MAALTVAFEKEPLASYMAAFPISLSVIRLAGLERNLDRESISTLQELEDVLTTAAPLESALNAPNERAFETALSNGFQKVFEYYLIAGPLIWRALDHDYGKLLRLCQDATKSLETLLFQHQKGLRKNSFINAVTAIRVLNRVGESVINAHKNAESGKEAKTPLWFLVPFARASFYTWYLVGYLTSSVQTARPANLKVLADKLLGVAQEIYREAVKKKISLSAKEENYWYWSPAWQSGEVEADLDLKLGNTEEFSSVKDLANGLRGS